MGMPVTFFSVGKSANSTFHCSIATLHDCYLFKTFKFYKNRQNRVICKFFVLFDVSFNVRLKICKSLRLYKIIESQDEMYIYEYLYMYLKQ